MAKEISIFDENYKEPTALATDVGKDVPILEGEVAERFEMYAKQNEEKAEVQEITIEEAKEILAYKKLLLSMAEEELKTLKNEIKKLEEIINLSK